jgi:hypothetical protein
MPVLPKPYGNGKLSAFEEADPRDWLLVPDDCQVVVQTLHQKNGYAVTLVVIDVKDDDESGNDDAGVEDAFDRFTRF